MHRYLFCYFSNWVAIEIFPTIINMYCFTILYFWDRVSLCNSVDCPGACYIDKASSNSDSPASASCVLGLKACATPSSVLHSCWIVYDQQPSMHTHFVWSPMYFCGCLLLLLVSWSGGGLPLLFLWSSENNPEELIVWPRLSRYGQACCQVPWPTEAVC